MKRLKKRDEERTRKGWTRERVRKRGNHLYTKWNP